jgi:Fe-S cluster assembly ATPase SufC
MFDYDHGLTAAQKERARQNVEVARQMPIVIAAESFAEKLKKAVAARRRPQAQTCKEHEEYVKRESARYSKPERRERTKGE